MIDRIGSKIPPITPGLTGDNLILAVNDRLRKMAITINAATVAIQSIPKPQAPGKVVIPPIPGAGAGLYIDADGNLAIKTSGTIGVDATGTAVAGDMKQYR